MPKAQHAHNQGDDDHTLRPSKKVKVTGSSKSSSFAKSVHSCLQPPGSPLTSDTTATGTLKTSTSMHHPRFKITDPELSLHDKLTSEEGQLEENPYYTLEQAREAAQREYNRRNAARGRIRRKYQINELQEKYVSMEAELKTLEQENEALKAELVDIKQRASTQSSDANTHILQQSHHERLWSPSNLLRQGILQSPQSLFIGLQTPNQYLMHRSLPLVPPQHSFPFLMNDRVAQWAPDMNVYPSRLTNPSPQSRNTLFNAALTERKQLVPATCVHLPPHTHTMAFHGGECSSD